MRDWLRALAFAATMLSAIAIAVGVVVLSVVSGTLWSLVFALPVVAVVLATAIFIIGRIFS